MDNGFKFLILIGVILYVLSPVDAAPGLIDDLIVAVMGIALRKSITKKSDQNNE